jgi:hypothetical protein
MNREAIWGIAAIIIAIILISIVAAAGEEDKYVLRDGCIYHKTKEFIGEGGFDVEYTLVTCEEGEFHKYTVEED